MWKNQVMNTLALSDLAQHLVPFTTWEPHLDNLTQRIAKRFARTEVREQARHYLIGLLSQVERKNGWQMAEHLGHQNPYRVQHLLDRAVWDTDAVCEDLRAYVVAHLGDPEGVLVIDESGFLKKGKHSCGVQRQYCGTAGRVENCQVGVFLGYATKKGHTLLDRELYLPKEWAADARRRKRAKVPKRVTFATKPQLAQAMLTRALDGGVPAAFVTGDSVYGNDAPLRQCLQARQQAYVLAIKCDLRLCWEGGHIRAQTLAKRLPPSAWHTLSAGEGAKGPRLFDWAYLPLDAPEPAGFEQGLLVRRSLSDPTELAYYLVFVPKQTPLATLVRGAGTRWTIEVELESAKGEVGLDEYEVRSWHGWYRHMTLCLLAHALLVVLRHHSLPPPVKGGRQLPRHCLRRFKQSRGLCCP
jgi:SRSO17 transposase